MTVYTLQAGTPALELPGGSFVQFEAVDPTTGLPVTGVVITNVGIAGLSSSPSAGGDVFIEVGQPLYTPGPNA